MAREPGTSPKRGRGGSGAGTVPSKPSGPVTPATPIGSSGISGAAVLRRVGPRLGIKTVRDLLFHLPRRYDDLRELSTAADLARVRDGEIASARLQVRGVRVEQTFRRRVERTTAYLGDETGEVEATWFGRRFIAGRLREGTWVVISGKIRHRGFTTTLDNPEFQPDDGSALLHAGRIVPVYRLTAGLTAATLRRAIRQALDRVGASYPEYLPAGAARQGEPGAARRGKPDVADDAAAVSAMTAPPLMSIAAALESAHFPESFPARDAALRRLGFDELLALQVGMVARERGRRKAVGERVDVPPDRIRRGGTGASHCRSGRRGRGDRGRPGTDTADDAAPARRRRIRQDRRRGACSGVRRGRRTARCAPCSDRPAGPPACRGLEASSRAARSRRDPLDRDSAGGRSACRDRTAGGAVGRRRAAGLDGGFGCGWDARSGPGVGHIRRPGAGRG